jgi:hypothetical protein
MELKLYCDNIDCVFNSQKRTEEFAATDNAKCTRDSVTMTNNGHMKIFWFSCVEYERRRAEIKEAK